ncbi:digestive cysteine proteinase 2-like [Battus philenor]|uniref:digestive cysteine proteinase 2-like n=1 Tax=Battus philenor TaxID=42288 RepID=UPI0035CF85AD
MHSSIIIILHIAVLALGGVIKDDFGPDLKWPKKYYIEVSKMSLTAGWVEDIKVWRTTNKSRIDYNNGAVKSIAIAGKKHSKTSKYGVKYEIYPMSTEEFTNEIMCKTVRGTFLHRVSLETILPKSLPDYEFYDLDPLRGGNYSRYLYHDIDTSKDNKKFLTVTFDEITENWIPVRFEEIEYNLWQETLTTHNVWDFHNFKTDFDDEVFSVEEYYCTESPTNTEPDVQLTNKKVFMDPENEEHVDIAFESFKRSHGKVYADDQEEMMRKDIFLRNMRLVVETNRQNLGYKLTINKFADRTPEEMKRHRGLIRRKENEVGNIAFPYDDARVQEIAETLPKRYDSRLEGLVTPVEDQEDCGSCWTFGTTSAVEGALARRNGGRLLRLSNQALIDCAWGFGASGCNGGSDTAAYKWIMKHGMPTEEEYGMYANKDGFCHIDKMTDTYQIVGFTDVTPFSVEALKVAVVNHGPLSVSIHATDSLTLYSGGIFYDPTCNPKKLNHEVTLVGYGEKEGEEYWIVKNSWGTRWGIDGYVHMSVRNNSCGVVAEPTYPVF